MSVKASSLLYTSRYKSIVNPFVLQILASRTVQVINDISRTIHKSIHLRYVNWLIIAISVGNATLNFDLKVAKVDSW